MMNINLKEKAYETIKDKIIHCEYRPNMILSEAVLMQEIDSSRTPVREALNKLEQEGFIQIIPKKGIIVTALSLNEVTMTFEARLLLEPYILDTSFQFIDRNKLKEIRSDIVRQLQDIALGTQNYSDFCRSDDQLHRTIVAACSNKYFNLSLEHIYDQNMRIRLLAGSHIWERHTSAAREHIELIDLILNNDKEKAKEVIMTHLTHSKDAAIRSLLDGTMPIC